MQMLTYLKESRSRADRERLCPSFHSHDFKEQFEFTMQPYGVLILFLTLSAASGLKCFTCISAQPESCTDIEVCPAPFDRCYSSKVWGFDTVSKGCDSSLGCLFNWNCCEGDLCNSSLQISPSLILLLLSSAILTLFL
ncbi:uncharacterized protein ACNS7B_011112 [Menidia menidia]